MERRPTQGPQAGRRFPAADETFADPETGVRVRKLTDFAAHSNHLYFTNDGWYDDGRRLVFNSDRGGAHNLYEVTLESGAVTQLTDLPALDDSYAHFSRNAAVDAARRAVYFWYGERLVALDLDSLTLDVLYETPDGFTYMGCHNSVTADGRYVCTSVREEVEADASGGRWHEGAAIWEAEPVTRILRVPIAGGEAEVVHEEATELSHTNASPTNPDVITYAQEGPWDRTSQRIWGLNLDTGENWKIRPEDDSEMLGHEFWLANGEDVGYHGRWPDGQPFFGITGYDNESRVEHPIPRAVFDHDGPRGHVNAHSREAVVSDGTPDDPYLFLWRRDGDGYDGPRRLARHGASTFDFGRLHVHPRFSPDGEQVLFCSDRTEYANLYLADVPEAGTLPPAE
ncbi:MAG: oligogalacturonate lyase family protein [Halobacteriaceae archaeon]